MIENESSFEEVNLVDCSFNVVSLNKNSEYTKNYCYELYKFNSITEEFQQ